MTAKSAYEIRLELLQLAHKIALEKHSVGNIAAQKSGTAFFTAPTEKEVIEIAETLNVFLCKK